MQETWAALSLSVVSLCLDRKHTLDSNTEVETHFLPNNRGSEEEEEEKISVKHWTEAAYSDDGADVAQYLRCADFLPC